MNRIKDNQALVMINLYVKFNVYSSYAKQVITKYKIISAKSGGQSDERTDAPDDDNIVKVTLNLSLSRCMLFAHCSSDFHPIFMKFDHHSKQNVRLQVGICSENFLVLRHLPCKFQGKIFRSLKVRPFDM